jgi:hypothetical protein
MRSRSAQENFQLIVITHDEHFAQVRSQPCGTKEQRSAVHTEHACGGEAMQPGPRGFSLSLSNTEHSVLLRKLALPPSTVARTRCRPAAAGSTLGACLAKRACRKKERKTYARCQACVKGALASKSHRGAPVRQLLDRELTRCPIVTSAAVAGHRHSRARGYAVASYQGPQHAAHRGYTRGPAQLRRSSCEGWSGEGLRLVMGRIAAMHHAPSVTGRAGWRGRLADERSEVAGCGVARTGRTPGGCQIAQGG